MGSYGYCIGNRYLINKIFAADDIADNQRLLAIVSLALLHTYFFRSVDKKIIRTVWGSYKKVNHHICLKHSQLNSYEQLSWMITWTVLFSTCIFFTQSYVHKRFCWQDRYYVLEKLTDSLTQICTNLATLQLPLCHLYGNVVWSPCDFILQNVSDSDRLIDKKMLAAVSAAKSSLYAQQVDLIQREASSALNIVGSYVADIRGFNFFQNCDLAGYKLYSPLLSA